MLDCLITFRSVLPAQRAETLLRKHGISCAVRRTPKWLEVQGCGYSLRLHSSRLREALVYLEEKQIAYRKLYKQGEDGKAVEVEL